MDLFALPILAAEGLEWLSGMAGRHPKPIASLGAALLVTGGIAASVLHWRSALSTGDQQAVLVAIAHFMWVVGFGGVALLVLWRRGPNWGAWAFALVTLVDLVSMDRGYVQPKPADYVSGTERFAAIDWLLAQHPVDRFCPDARGPFRLLNVGMTYGIDSATGYDSVSVWRYDNFLYVLNHGTPYPWTRLKDDLAAGVVRRFDSPLVDLLNIRWVVSDHLPAPGWTERYRLPPNEPVHARYERRWDRALRVYENPHPLPRAFVVYNAHVLLKDQDQAKALATLNPRTTAILDAEPRPAPVGDGRAFTPADLVAASDDHLVIDAVATAPGILVVSETDYPGWSVSVDGRPAALLHADYAFRGVALPAGRHRIEMKYRSKPTRIGIGLSLVGLLGLIGLGLLPGRRAENRGML